MSERDQLAKELRAFVVENYLFGDGSTLQVNDSFLEKGFIDSTGILELVAFVEEKFGLQIQDHELVPDNLDSVAALSAFVTRKLSETGQRSQAS